MTEEQKRDLKAGQVVRTASGNYIVAKVGPDDDVILVRCFRMGGPAKYQHGFRLPVPTRRKQ